MFPTFTPPFLLVIGEESSSESSSSGDDSDGDHVSNAESNSSLRLTRRSLEREDIPQAGETVGDLPQTSLLGKAPCDPQKFGEDVHGDIASRWSVFLTKGIDREDKKALLESYPFTNNCRPLQAPKLNSEVTSILNESIIRQDMYLGRLQEEIGISISALALPLNKFYSNPLEENKVHLKPLADAAKLLCNAHHSLSTHRRHAIMPYINSSTRKLMEEFPIEESLFGDKFADRIKSSKELQKTSLDIRAPTKPSTSKNYQRPFSKYKNKGKYKGKEPLKSAQWKPRQATFQNQSRRKQQY